VLQNVVVGVDGSADGRRALDWAVREVAGTVHAVHAVSPSMELMAAGFQIDTGPLVRRLRAQLDDEWTAGLGTSRATVRTRLIEDSPAQAMLRAAGETDAEAIAVGVRGLDSSSRMIGATTGQLVHLSPRPVVVVPSVDDTSAGSSTIVVAVAARPDEDTELLHWAAMVARGQSTKLRVVYADTSVPGPRTRAGAPSPAARRLDAWLHGQDAGSACDVEVIAADPITALVDASRDAAMLVVGSRRSTRLAAYLNGAVANHLPTVSHCPVAMVPLTATRP